MWKANGDDSEGWKEKGRRRNGEGRERGVARRMILTSGAIRVEDRRQEGAERVNNARCRFRSRCREGRWAEILRGTCQKTRLKKGQGSADQLGRQHPKSSRRCVEDLGRVAKVQDRTGRMRMQAGQSKPVPSARTRAGARNSDKRRGQTRGTSEEHARKRKARKPSSLSTLLVRC